MNWKIILLSLFFWGFTFTTDPYPIDGYDSTGIRRLKRLELIEKDSIKGRKLIPGALKTMEEIRLRLLWTWGDSLNELLVPDSILQDKIEKLFPRRDESYSMALLDITPGEKTRYAQIKPNRGYQPGSVGKLVVISGFFNELKKIFPEDFEKRRELLKTKFVRAGKWVIYDEHTVPFYDPETKKYFRREVGENDVFSLYEWADHMMSVSNNGAACVVWRETILMRAFGDEYPKITDEQANEYFKTTPRSELMDMAEIIHEPLREVGITEDEWRLGSMFTRGGKSIVPGRGGSRGTPLGLLKWLVELERGCIVDIFSSLEIKRLMYMTDRRIRYASSKVLRDAAVYFKSGSLYSCRPEEGFTCGKYRGNSKNYMNSVAIIEQPDTTTYLVVLMSNVLKKNSSYEHNYLAGRIDKILREEIE
jgi:hypothetical protein